MGYNMKRGNSGVKFKSLGSSPAKMHESGHDNKETVSKTSPGPGWTKTKGTNIWAPPKGGKRMAKKEGKLMATMTKTLRPAEMKAPYARQGGPRAESK